MLYSFTNPALSAEVECMFLFVSHLVSKHCHSMAAYTVQATATLGAYLQADLVPAGILAKAHCRARKRTQAKAQARAAKAKAKAAVAEAEAIAAAQEVDDNEDDEGSKDNKDVLQPSSNIKDVDFEDNNN